jgi:hypothetical protein
MTQIASASSISDDLLTGAEKIAEFVFADTSPQTVRKTRHLIRTKVIPAFKLGGVVAARKTTVLRAIEALDKKSA